ncbi:MAG: FAD-dependent oxidoreductase [Actinomycetota bacterium]
MRTSDVIARSDVAVIGGGVIGTSTAWWLEQAGLSVTVVERRPELGTLTTPNALGTIRTQYGDPTLIALAQESLEFYRNLETRLGVNHDDIAFSNPGYLYLTDREDDIGRLRDSLAMYEGLGVKSSRMVDQTELRERFPFTGSAVAGIFHGDGCFVDPASVTGAWAGRLRHTNVLTDTDVHALAPGATGWSVTTSRGEVHAGAVVIAAGPYAAGLLAGLGVGLPVKITPRYRVFIPDDDPHHQAAPLVINVRNGAYWRPVPGGVWLSTANVDDRSVPPQETVEVPPDFLGEVIEEIRPVSPALAATAEAADRSALRFAGGFQVYPADDVPIIGAVPGHDGLFVNGGHWAGVMLSPASGRLCADLVTGDRSEAENPCGFGRFDRAVTRSSTNKFGGWG